MSRLRRGAIHLWLTAACVVATYAGPAALPAARTDPVAAAREAAQLRAGLARADITPPIGVPLAGYGGRRRPLLRWPQWHKYAHAFEPSTGILDPVHARVLYLENGSQRLVFIGVDLIGSDDRMRHALATELAPSGLAIGDLWLSASHTHSGPGAFAKNWFWATAAADQYVDSVFIHLVATIAGAVRSAIQAAEPASLKAFSFETHDLQKNRRDPTAPVDPTANVLLVTNAAGRTVGGIANVAMHGTALAEDSLVYSADVTGSMQRALEAALKTANGSASDVSPIVVFVNGAEGDVAPAEDGTAGMASIGAAFAQQAMAASLGTRPVDGDWSVWRANVELGRARVNLAGCKEIPAWSRWLLYLPNLAIATAFPRRTEVSLLRLGGEVMMSWPGEPTSSLGLTLKQAASDAGVAHPWVLGLTNAHLAYFVNEAEYRETSYEACSSLFGATGGTKIIETFRTLLSEM